MTSRQWLQQWSRIPTRFLPFADVATVEVPLRRLLRLSLFQVSVGMALVLLVGTLNRVMIVEMGVSAGLVALMVALPVLYAPTRALIGFRSDHHRSALGWRRVPYIWMGTLIQFGGLAMMPFALLVLSGGGNASQWPSWLGPAGAALAFLLVGAGLHTTQTAGLALATDLTRKEIQPRVVGLMYVMLLVGTMTSALAFGGFLRDYSPGRLVQVIQAAAVMTLILNVIALWKQEVRRPRRGLPEEREGPEFADAWRGYVAAPGAWQRLLVIALGTLGFGMQDVLLEPYGGQVLGLGVGATTWLTATMAAGGLLGFGLASHVLSRGVRAMRMTLAGAWLGVPAFAAVILAATTRSVPLLVAGAFAIGAGAGMFGHGTLTATMQAANPDESGLALGAWGAVQATAAGVALALGGLGRDAVQWFAALHAQGQAAAPTTGYAAVFATEMLLLLATVAAASFAARSAGGQGLSAHGAAQSAAAVAAMRAPLRP
jgi:BCD family chlorophyll transporter-like MFS transporter